MEISGRPAPLVATLLAMTGWGDGVLPIEIAGTFFLIAKLPPKPAPLVTRNELSFTNRQQDP
jgi:hypothetical protein